MKIKTSELQGAALDWAVAKCEWFREEHNWIGTYRADYSSDWNYGGPILEREGINTFKHNKLDPSEPDKWCGHKVVPRPNMEGSANMVAIALDGPTPLVAAMRCHVASKLGDEVDVPDELCGGAA